MAGISVKLNFDPKELAKKALGGNSDASQTALAQALEGARRQIINRTVSGQGVDGQPFAGYSQRYIKELQREKESTNVDLYRSGQMLRDMQILRIYKDGVNVIGVMGFLGGTDREGGNSIEKARKHMQGDRSKGLPQRRFFGLSDSQVEEITNKVRKAFNR